ncbi:MAG: 30S ribosomal protein S9 [Chitinophagales bacterium]
MYTIATGRRKAAIARVYLKPGKGTIEVNGKDYKEYFPVKHLIHKIEEPFKVTETEGKYDVKVNTVGGGVKGQAEALALGISRALIEIDAEYKPVLKEHKLVTRDPRVVERKKPGKKKARKSFQFSKR